MSQSAAFPTTFDMFFDETLMKQAVEFTTFCWDISTSCLRCRVHWKNVNKPFMICFHMKTWDRFFDETLTNWTVEFTILFKNKNKQTNKNLKINQNKKERKENQVGNFDLHHKNFAFFLSISMSCLRCRVHLTIVNKYLVKAQNLIKLTNFNH